MSGRSNLPEALKKAVERVNPDLKLQGPVLGKVVEHFYQEGQDGDGRPADAPTIDVQVVKELVVRKKDGTYERKYPNHPDWHDLVTLSVPTIVGDAEGKSFILGQIGVGTLVRVAFYELDPARPYLDAVLGKNKGGIAEEALDDSTAQIYIRWKDGRILIDDGSNIHLRSLKEINTDASGNSYMRSGAEFKIDGKTILVGKGAEHPIPLGDLLMTWLLEHTHMHPLGPTTGPMPTLHWNADMQHYLSDVVKVKKE